MSDRTNYDFLEIRDDIGEKIEVLSDFADHEGTEVGESVRMLCQMWRYMPDYFSESLYEECVDEIDLRYNMVQNDYKVIEEEETFTRTFKSYEYRP